MTTRHSICQQKLRGMAQAAGLMDAALHSSVHAEQQLFTPCSASACRTSTHRKHPVALLLALVAVDGQRRPAVLPQLPRQQVAPPLGLAEDLQHGKARMYCLD